MTPQLNEWLQNSSYRNRTFTICRIARGETERPRIDTVEKIRGWLDSNLAPTP